MVARPRAAAQAQVNEPAKMPSAIVMPAFRPCVIDVDTMAMIAGPGLMTAIR